MTTQIKGALTVASEEKSRNLMASATYYLIKAVVLALVDIADAIRDGKATWRAQ